MKKQLLVLLIICLFGFSCKKTELPANNEEDSPVFYFKGNVNGLPLKIEAGVNNYLMNASYFQDNNNLYVYKAEFKQSSCSNNCGYGLTVLINDFKLSLPNSRMSVDSALKMRPYGFIDASLEKLYYRGIFEPVTATSGPLDDYGWKFNNADPQSTEKANYVFEAGKTYSVSLKFGNALGCVSELGKEFKIGNPLQTNIRLKSISGTTCEFSAETGGNGPYTYSWDFGNGTSPSADAIPKVTYDASQPFDYDVKLTLTDAANNTCVSSYQVRSTTACNANFNSSFTPFINPKLLSAIGVQLTDPNGTVYSSSNIQQPANSNFEVVSVEDYKMNDKNQPTKKIKIKFNCSFNTPDGPVQITDGEAVIAVAYY